MSKCSEISAILPDHEESAEHWNARIVAEKVIYELP